MQRIGHPILSVAERQKAPRVLFIALVGLLHATLIAALIGGLASRIVQSVPSVLHASVLDTPKPDLTPPPPPPLAQPTPPSAPLPEISIRTPAPQHTITLAVAPPHPVPFVPAPAVQAVPPPPAPTPTSATAIGATHTTPPYPEMSRRLGEHGMVRVEISISAEGVIEDVSVAQSSGSDRLDQAAVGWVKSHWRYHPATRNGAPVASLSAAEIVFDLKNA